jgi:hypothetical protein
MSLRTIVSLAASTIVGIVCLATISTDALAYRKGAGVHHGAVRAAPAVAIVVAVGDGPVADRIPRCLDSVIFYPYPPCY